MVSGYWITVPPILTVAIMMSVSALPAYSEEPEHEDRSENMSVEFAPYIWGPQISGSVSFGALGADLNLQPLDLFSDVDAGFMGAGVLRQKRNFIVFDGLWLDYSNDAFEPFFNQAVDVELKYLQAGIGRSFHVDSMLEDLTIEPFIGAQYVSLNPNLSGALGRISVEEEWLSPAIGLMVSGTVSGRVSTTIKLDYASGFSDGDLVSVVSVLNYALTENASIAAGFRWSEGELSAENGFGLDLEGGGPILGLRWKL